MQTTVEHIAGDTDGVTWRVPVLRFSPQPGASGPSVYLQAALHANEQPGTGALHVLSGRLRGAEAAGELLGSVTIVPVANPIGLAQHLFGDQMGRFDTASRVNFNREYPLLDQPDVGLLDAGGPWTGAEALKRRLLALAMPHDIVLDLHCDDEAVPYLYMHGALWPIGQDLAVALGAEAVVLWDGPDGGAAFEEAALAPWLAVPTAEAHLDRRVVATVELRGRRDVSEELGGHDAEGLWRFLLGRGVVAGELPLPRPFAGVAASIRRVTMVRASQPGTIWYHVSPGDRVEAGARLATILHRPGEALSEYDVAAPHAGYVLTRRAHRYTRAGEDLLKLVGDGDSAGYRPGTLEA